MQKFALIGNPVAHSLSPALFNKAYQKETASSRMSYKLIQAQTVEEALQMLREGGYAGANVTAPFKEAVMQYVTHPDATTALIGAANVIKFDGAKLLAYNTDYSAVRAILPKLIHQLANNSTSGSYKDISAIGHNYTDNTIEVHRHTAATKDFSAISSVIIGCGGAGKAAALACRDLGCHVMIANRTFEKARLFAQKIGTTAIELNHIEETLSALTGNHTPPAGMMQRPQGASHASSILVIYTIPAAIPQAVPQMLKECVVIEPNYKNPVLQNCGKKYVDGQEWLVAQAIEGFKILTGKHPAL